MTENTDFTPPSDPLALFREWYALAQEKEPSYPDAMTLATVGADGMLSARTVLMKSFDAKGIVFHTNRNSRKGRELAQHAKAAVCFHWKSIERQVRIEGIVSVIDDKESDEYFATRPRGSQIGAWASQQSQPLESREKFEQRIRELETKYEGKDVPRPPHWGGYLLKPTAIEFWQERLYRLHDRFVYRQASDKEVWADDRITYQRRPDAGNWSIERLYP